MSENSLATASSVALELGPPAPDAQRAFGCVIVEHASYVLIPALFIGLIPLGLVLNLPWLGLVVGAVVVPLVDEVIGRKEACVTGPSIREVRFLLGALVVALIWSLIQVAQLESWLDIVLAAASSGYVVGAVGLPTAHELGHRRSSFDKSIGLALLACIGYAHYQVSHHRHHVRVGLPDDPATAHRQDSLYTFFPRYWIGIWHDATAMAARFKGYRRHAPALLLLASVLLLGLVAVVFGLKGAAYWLIQAAIGLFLIGSVDYIQHWGLRRALLADSRYERAGPDHAWESPYWFSERITLNLTRHGFHHLIPTREADALQRLPKAPQMPSSYGTMVVVAMIPPLFRRMMEPHLPARMRDPEATQATGAGAVAS